MPWFTTTMKFEHIDYDSVRVGDQIYYTFTKTGDHLYGPFKVLNVEKLRLENQNGVPLNLKANLGRLTLYKLAENQ